MGPNANFVTGLVAKEDALLRVLILLRMHTGQSTSIASGSVDGEGAIDVTSCLIELDGLPGVLGGLADARSVDDCAVAMLRSLRLSVRVHILTLNVSLYLILTETQWQIQLEGLIILPGLRFLKACLVRVGRRSRATLSSAARILRPMVV